MSNDNAVIEGLGRLFTENFHIEVPSPDTDLLESGILDSFQFVELLLELELRFNFRISIEDIDLEDLRTLRRISRLVGTLREPAESVALQPCAGTPD